jgi:hypothetical protein
MIKVGPFSIVKSTKSFALHEQGDPVLETEPQSLVDKILLGRAGGNSRNVS